MSAARKFFTAQRNKLPVQTETGKQDEQQIIAYLRSCGEEQLLNSRERPSALATAVATPILIKI